MYVGKKTITYYGVTKNIYSIVVGERNLERNYYAMIMKNKETEGVVDATYTDYGKTIEELALSLCPQIFNDNNYSANTYWITGYGLVFNDDMEIDEEELMVLRQLADKANAKYANQKGSRGIRLKGMTEDEVISSGYSVESKLQYIRSITNSLLAGVGVDADYRDLIDKNYLMVKHAMENQHIKDTIKDYCNGIVFTSESKLSQGQFDGKNSKVAILSDFQAVELKDKLEKRNSTHSDDDGISDGEELGIEIERDITPFVEKCNGGRAGLFVKAQQWKEFNEGISYTGTGDSDVIIKAKMWNYKSNPVLNDTDFDGLDDNAEQNKNPLSNDFSGSTMTVDSDNYVLDLDFNQDFRYFLWNSDTYNDELCTMSLIMSNLAQNKRITIKQGTINYGSNLSIQNYMSKLGFYNIQSENISYDGVTANVYIGYKTIDYYRKKRGVIGIFIGGLNNDKANDKMALTLENLTESNNYYNIIAEKIREKVNIDRLGITELFNCYWISGKGIAGGVAAELAYLYGTEEVYCYTFGSPYTHKSSGSQYAPYVKNVINEDDLLIKKISDENDYSRLGEMYNASIKFDYMDEYRTYIGVSPSEYKGDCSRMNTMISQFIKFVKGEPSTREVLLAALSKNTGNGSTSVTMSPLTTVVNDATIEISNTNDAQKDGSSIKSYYVLSKVLEGVNKSVGKDEKYNGVNVSPQSDKEESDKWGNGNTKVADALKLIGTWYCDNVYTYEAGNKKGDTPEIWTARFYEAIDNVHTQETRRGMAKNTSNSIQNRLNHINEWNEGKIDTEKFTDDCDTIQQRVQWNDRFLAAEAYTWQNSDGAYGKYECEHFTDNGYPNNKMSDDCSGFALMVLDYATGGALYNELGSTIYSCGNGSLVSAKDSNPYVKALNNCKVERKRVTDDMDMSYLQSGDLLVSSNHCEFFYKEGISNKQFGWGSPKVAFPNMNFAIKKGKNNTYFNDSGHNYIYIYRLVE